MQCACAEVPWWGWPVRLRRIGGWWLCSVCSSQNKKTANGKLLSVVRMHHFDPVVWYRGQDLIKQIRDDGQPFSIVYLFLCQCHSKAWPHNITLHTNNLSKFNTVRYVDFNIWNNFNAFFERVPGSYKRCCACGERQSTRSRKTAGRSRGMRMKVLVHAPMSVSSTSISTLRKKQKVARSYTNYSGLWLLPLHFF